MLIIATPTSPFSCVLELRPVSKWVKPVVFKRSIRRSQLRVVQILAGRKRLIVVAQHNSRPTRLLLDTTQHTSQNTSQDKIRHRTRNAQCSIAAPDSIVVLHGATADFATTQQGLRVWWRFHEPCCLPV
jgi:hypothetical protein